MTQLEFLEKIQYNFLDSCTATVKNFDDFFKNDKIQNMLLPLNLIITKDDLLKLIKTYSSENLFALKCLFIHYKLNLEDNSMNILFKK